MTHRKPREGAKTGALEPLPARPPLERIAARPHSPDSAAIARYALALEARALDPRFRALLKAARRVEARMSLDTNRDACSPLVELRDALAALKEVDDD